MTRRKKRLLAFAMLSGVAAFWIFSLLSGVFEGDEIDQYTPAVVEAPKPPPPPPKPRYVEVYALKKAAFPGYIIELEDLTSTRVNYNLLGLYIPAPPDAFESDEEEEEKTEEEEAEVVNDGSIAYTNINDLVSAFVVEAIGAGQPILEGAITLYDGENPLQRNLARRMRLWTANFPASAAADGLLEVGDRVDVVFSHSGDGDTFAKILLKNVKILSIDGRTHLADGEDGEATRGRRDDVVVGLEVMPADAEALSAIEADRQSSIKLLPRHRSDTALGRSEGVRVADILGVTEEVPETVVAAEPVEDVLILRGDD